MKLGPGKWCGTPGGYTNHQCRCDACTSAWRVYHYKHMHASPERLRRQRDAARRARRKPRVA